MLMLDANISYRFESSPPKRPSILEQMFCGMLQQLRRRRRRARSSSAGMLELAPRIY